MPIAIPVSLAIDFDTNTSSTIGTNIIGSLAIAAEAPSVHSAAYSATFLYGLAKAKHRR